MAGCVLLHMRQDFAFDLFCRAAVIASCLLPYTWEATYLLGNGLVPPEVVGSGEWRTKALRTPIAPPGGQAATESLSIYSDSLAGPSHVSAHLSMPAPQ